MFYVRTKEYHFLCTTIHKYGNRQWDVGVTGQNWSGDGRNAYKFIHLEDAQKAAKKYNGIVCYSNGNEVKND